MDFLADARTRGLLRQTSVTYQFRHIRLQERLVMRPGFVAAAHTADVPGRRAPLVRRRTVLGVGVACCTLIAGRGLLGRLVPAERAQLVVIPPGSDPESLIGVDAVGFSSSGASLLTVSGDGSICRWDCSAGTPSPSSAPTHRISPNLPDTIDTGTANAVAFDDDTDIVTVATSGGLIWQSTWGESAPGSARQLPITPTVTTTVGYTSNLGSALIATTPDDSTPGVLQVWDMADRIQFAPLSFAMGSNTLQAASLDCRTIAVVAADADGPTTVNTWTGRGWKTIDLQGAWGGSAVAVSPLGLTVVLGSDDGTVTVIPLDDIIHATSFHAHEDTVRAITFAGGSETRFATGSDDGTAKVWSVPD
jgi:hypothetical protein